MSAGRRILGEEYRRNTPVMYYAYDANFLDYLWLERRGGGGQRLCHLEQP